MMLSADCRNIFLLTYCSYKATQEDVASLFKKEIARGDVNIKWVSLLEKEAFALLRNRNNFVAMIILDTCYGF